MSIVDELIVKLKLDLGRFRSDAQQAESTLNNVGDASRRTARNMESDGNHMASGFSKVRNQLLSILGLFTAGMGIKNFTQSTIKQADAFGFMSDSIGMSTTRLRAYSDAAERAGGSGEAMTDALKKSASDVANLKMGLKTLGEVDQGNLLTRWAGAAGLDPSKIFESGESLLQARLKVFEAIRKADKDNPLLHGVDPAVLANTVLEQGGIGGGVTNALKNKGGLAGFNASVSEREKLNAPLAGAEESARKAREAFFDLDKEVSVFSQNAVISATPAITKLTKALSKIKLPSAEKVSETIDKWTAKFEKGVGVADKYAKALHFESAWQMLSSMAEKHIDRMTKAWKMLADALPSPEAVGAFVDKWKPKLDNFTDKTLEPAIQKSLKFSKVLIEDWNIGKDVAVKGLSELAEKTRDWTDNLSSAISKVQELASATADWLEEKTGISGTDAQQGLQDFVGKTAALLGDEDAQAAVITNETYKKGSTDQRALQSQSIEYLQQIGHTKEEAIGITANLWGESNLNPMTYGGAKYNEQKGGKSEAYGLMQWHADRRKLYTEKFGHTMQSVTDRDQALKEQLQFASWELQHNESKGWEKTKAEGTSAKAIAAGFAKYIERPADKEGAARERGGHAGAIEKWYTPKISRSDYKGQPVIIPKGEKDFYGHVKGASSLYASMPSATSQTSPRVNNNSITIGSQTFNIKANDTEGIKKELSNKMIISESLTQNFNSGMQ